jgi:hypothetical protein
MFLALGGELSFVCASGSSDALPGRILIAKWGENPVRGTNHVVKVGPQTVASLAAEQKRRGWDTVSLDYEHQSVPGHKNYKQDPREYAAHGRVEVVEGKGLYYVPSKYTPSGKMHAASYADVSGFFAVDTTTNEVLAVHSVALCQHGCIEGAEFDQAIAAAMLSAGGASAEVDEILTFARELLGLGEDATATDVRAELEKQVRAMNAPEPSTTPKKPTSPPTKSKAMSEDNKDKEMDDLKKQVASLATTMGDLTKNVGTIAASLQTNTHNSAVEEQFRAASLAGKVVPDELKKKSEDGRYKFDADAVKSIMASIPQTVATEFTTNGSPVLPTAMQENSADRDKQICASMGISEEAWKKGHGLINGAEPHGESKKQLATAA